MVKFIAHRGNIAGPQPTFENTDGYLKHAYANDCFVEVDIIKYQDKLYYGHDDPKQLADLEFLFNPGVYCHAKTLDTLIALLDMKLTCFWHENDQVTLTSDDKIWCYPGHHPVHHSAIWLDLHNKPLPKENLDKIYAVCGDYKDYYSND